MSLFCIFAEPVVNELYIMFRYQMAVSQSVLVVGCAIFPPSSHGVTAQED